MLRLLVRLFICFPLALLGTLIGFGAIAAFFSTPRMVLLGIAFTGFSTACLYCAARWWNPRGLRRTANSDGSYSVSVDVPDRDPLYICVRYIVQQHIHTLTVEQSSKLVPDKYGVIDLSSWQREKDSFSSRVASPHVHASLSRGQYVRAMKQLSRRTLGTTKNSDSSGLFHSFVSAVIDAEISKNKKHSTPTINPTNQYSTPDEFESWCASELRAAGWEASVIGQAGDQGVDVRAERYGVVLVVQCKWYSSPVGNKAIQEVFAGKTFHRGHIAAVVATAGFTKSARALAKRTNVRLLAPSQLQELHLTMAEASHLRES